MIPYTRKTVQDKKWCDICRRTGIHPKKINWREASLQCEYCQGVFCEQHKYCTCRADD